MDGLTIQLRWFDHEEQHMGSHSLDILNLGGGGDRRHGLLFPDKQYSAEDNRLSEFTNHGDNIQIQPSN